MLRPIHILNRSRFHLAGWSLLLVCLSAPLAAAQEYVDQDNRYPILEGVGLTEKLDEIVPGDLVFRDLQDKEVKLGDYFTGERSIVLTLNYASCPKLCGLQLGGLAQSLGRTDLEPGEDYDLITISLDPNETAEASEAVLQGFLTRFGREVDSSSWFSLRGTEANIRAAADSVGFGYAYDEKSGEYAHTATSIVLSPEGKVCRYIRGFDPDVKTLSLMIKEASLGQSGSAFDQVLFFCFSYDSSTGQYTLAAWRLLRTCGALTVVFLITGIWMLQRSRARDESQ